ncbi:hypothetical protein CERZMDRAFT_89927 [Cercospora zeae-maydis SCOH1-5]|uniref:Uncharacterized protein n=1 Tax=Cercospora zeae-maydis SCOH1-5 TaxID=717836 RepID=A0A6A6FTI3_9PEZI|nr:hypothetical protein CERZMDRAFT_89927 [Cercospora zeae-maydis SCOH1-5]
MPHMKFDQTTLEPRLVSQGSEYFIRLLTRQQGRVNFTTTTTTTTTKSPPAAPTASKAYPAAVRPQLDKKKKKKAKSTYCLRLVRALDRYDVNPAVYDPSCTLEASQLLPILRLPSELRQKMLDNVLDDEDVLFSRPNSTIQALALTCKRWALDLPEVKKL